MTDDEIAKLTGASSKPAVTLTDDDVAKAAGSGQPEWLTKGAKAPPRHGTPTGGPNDLERIMNEARASGQQAEGPGFFSRAGESIKQGAGAVAHVGGEIIQDPKVLANPSKRRELIRGVGDVVTLGYGNRLAARIGNALGDVGRGETLNETQHLSADPSDHYAAQQPSHVEAADAVAAPQYRTAGQVTGSFLPSAISKIGGGLVSRALNVPAKGIVAPVALGTAKGIAGYEATAPLTAALSADSEGDRLGAAERAAKDPAGLMASSIGGALGGVGKGYRDSARDPSTLAGRTASNIEANGGKINMFGKPVSGGIYDSPELTELPKGRAGVNELADQGQTRIHDRAADKLAEARKAYGQESNAILAEHADQPHRATATESVLSEMEKRAKLSSGKIADKDLHSFVRDVRDLISTDTDQIDRQHLVATGEAKVLTKPEVPVADLIKIKQMVDDAAEWKSPPTKQNAPYRLIYHALAEDAAAVDPRIGELNKRYGQTMEEVKAAHDVLYGQRKTDINVTAAKERAAALRLGRVGDETQAATGAAERQVDQLSQMDPAYKRELDLIKAKKDIERLRYGEPETSTSIEKGFGAGVRRAILPTIGAAMGFHFGGPLGAAAGAAASQVAKNPLAMKLRIGLPLADKVGDAGVMGSRAGTMLESIRRGIEAKRRRDMESQQ